MVRHEEISCVLWQSHKENHTNTVKFHFLLRDDTIKCLGPEALSGLVEADANNRACLAVNHVHYLILLCLAPELGCDFWVKELVG